MTKRIYISRNWPPAALERAAALGSLTVNHTDVAPTPETWLEILTQYDVVCPTVTDQLDGPLLDAAAAQGLRCGLLANFGVGFNHIDIDAAHRHGVLVSNTPGVLTQATAEIALTLMLMSARRTAEGERLVRQGAWQGWTPTHMLSMGLDGRTLGIFGMGRIGIALARKAHFGLGMRVLYASRSPLDAATAEALQAERVELDELLTRSDVVSLNCPATPETRHIINARALSLMQPHAHLINTARGDVVDEVALVAALRQGQIAGASAGSVS